MKFLLLAISLTYSVNAADKLPKVLFLGDSITSHVSGLSGRELKGKIQVKFIQIQDSTNTLKNWDKLIGNEKWDLIYFNFGFNDLVYKAPHVKQVRAMSKQGGAVITTSPDLYEKNLQAIAKRIKKMSSKTIWASTTPISKAKYAHLYDPGLEVKYNRIAQKVMTQESIGVLDLYSHVKKLTDGNKNFDGFSFNRNVPEIHKIVVDHLRDELKLN